MQPPHRWRVMKQIKPALWAAILGALLAAAAAADTPKDSRQNPVKLQMKIIDVKSVTLWRLEEGGHLYEVRWIDGRQEEFAPDQFATLVHDADRHRSWVESVLNVSTPIGFAWVGFGFLGQVLFTGRMVVQWLVSEKKKRSVVPVAFWWMSLIGATMLLIYFIWRVEPVGIIGQVTGWLIYVRNLWMIYRRRFRMQNAE